MEPSTCKEEGESNGTVVVASNLLERATFRYPSFDVPFEAQSGEYLSRNSRVLSFGSLSRYEDNH